MPVVRMPGEIKPQEGQIQNWLGFHKQNWVVGELIRVHFQRIVTLGLPKKSTEKIFVSELM